MRLPLLVSAFVATSGCALLLCAPRAAHAQIIYQYSTVLSLASGTDTLGFNGASAVVRFTVPVGATYVNRFNYPAAAVNNPQVTFSGASVAANNGTFSLPATAFYPSYAGFYTEPDGLYLTLALPVGGTLTLDGSTVPTLTGNTVQVGNSVKASDFGPTTSRTGFQWSNSNGAMYNLNNTVITTISPSAAPEPSSFPLLGMGLVTGASMAGTVRRRKQNARKAAHPA